ncbi:hypothetical protein KOI35_33525 [Actinoplanes bogorensis]|uniref:Uncharacterized protein n=1 Tax=Paractinoplanes bogorensis TaxID=1610840 RepID=A0ABS5Z217_9ACTN|nr:hypothetical protein [Actinoplanes bogorensis]MBU2668445.1 hypothetical protein [Actinoplanes bogorensis]
MTIGMVSAVMRSRARWAALVAGIVLVLLSCAVLLVVPAVLEPSKPWDDVEEQQAAWGATLDRVLWTGFGLGTLGAALLAIGSYRPRR